MASSVRKFMTNAAKNTTMESRTNKQHLICLACAAPMIRCRTVFGMRGAFSNMFCCEDAESDHEDESDDDDDDDGDDGDDEAEKILSYAFMI